LPGCITTGRAIEEVEHNIREAIELHLEGLREDGEPVPDPHSLHRVATKLSAFLAPPVDIAAE
jgi:predicted RNase H-like HicB family nuclease